MSSAVEPPAPSPTRARRERTPHPAPQTIAVVGFGNFGQFLGATFAAQGHRVVGCSRGDYADAAAAIGCEYVRDANALLDTKPDVVVLCTSIMSLSSVLARFPVDRLAGRLVVDVLSVKEYPKGMLLEVLPESADILCTHPMFGPESANVSWAGLPFVYDVVRLNSAPRVHVIGKQRCETFLDIWRLEGCTMVEMECRVHDEYAASTQFITHTTGRMLAELDVKTTPINTRGYESLLGVVDNTTKDSFDLYYGLYRYNANARAVLDKLETGLSALRAKLEAAERDERSKQ
jgi:arogenate dehydrogenase (NADP+), plant